MAPRSVTLPGISTKYELETDKKDTIAVFFLKNVTSRCTLSSMRARPPALPDSLLKKLGDLSAILTGAIMEADRESVEIPLLALSYLRL
jgi:hypothetical protein